LLQSLLADAHDVAVLTRDAAAARLTLPTGCDAIEWNPEKGELDADAMAGAAAIVHLAGTGVADKRWSPARRDSILQSRVAGGEAIARAVAVLGRDQQPDVIVGGSAVGFYGDRGQDTLDERDGAGEGFLADVCVAWEASLAGTGIRTVSLRTGVVLASGGGALPKMLPAFRLGLGGRLGSGRQWMSWIHIDDLVGLIRFAIDEVRLEGAVNATAPTPVTNADFTRILARTLHRWAILPVPAPLLRLALGELSSMLLGGQRVLPAKAEALGCGWQYGDLEAAFEELLGATTSAEARHP
jgi:uncharacterized protein (TIGR01777 family)